MKRPRRAAFMPLHLPHCERPPIFPSASDYLTLKRHECRAPNPNGIPSQSPGLRGTSYLGSWSRDGHNPNGVASFLTRPCAATPLGLMKKLIRVPRVARASQPWAERRYPVGVIPIPAASPAEQAVLSGLVEGILAAQRTGDAATVKALEQQIDAHVFRLYACGK